MAEVGIRIGRSKDFCLIALDDALGHLKLSELDRERLIKFGRDRAREGAGPVTLVMNLGYIKTVLTHAAAVHGVPVSTEPLDLARIALKRLGLNGKGNERDRSPTQSELDLITAARDENSRQIIPVGRIIRFAVATTMLHRETCMLLIRGHKDPRKKGATTSASLRSITTLSFRRPNLAAGLLPRTQGRLWPTTDAADHSDRGRIRPQLPTTALAKVSTVRCSER